MTTTPGTDFAKAMHAFYRGERSKPSAREFGIDFDLAAAIERQCRLMYEQNFPAGAGNAGRRASIRRLQPAPGENLNKKEL